MSTIRWTRGPALLCLFVIHALRSRTAAPLESHARCVRGHETERDGRTRIEHALASSAAGREPVGSHQENRTCPAGGPRGGTLGRADDPGRGHGADTRDRPLHERGPRARKHDRECRRDRCHGGLGGRARPRPTASRPRWTAPPGRVARSESRVPTTVEQTSICAPATDESELPMTHHRFGSCTDFKSALP